MEVDIGRMYSTRMRRFGRTHLALVGLAALLVGGACADEAGHTRGVIERPHPVSVAGGERPVVVPDVVEAPETIEAPDAPAPVDANDVLAEDTAPTETGDTLLEADAAPTGPTLPFEHVGDTSALAHGVWDRYACAPETDESGPEEVFTFVIERMGILRARVDDVGGDGIDVDVHLLAGDGPQSCVRRDNTALAWVVRPGAWTVVVDTWVGADGVARVGPYRLEVDLLPLDEGSCALEDFEQRMFWGACTAGPPLVDCRDDGATRWLRVPSLGPVVGEAHLVTVEEPFEGNGWPSAARDQIERHYAISQAATGYVMERDEPWAPEGEGGSQWGGGATGQKLPVLDEAWYVNMYWRDRPPRGRRMLVVEPWSGRAVVAAGGWETGPGSNTAIGGAVEEIHHHLGSRHRQDLVMGFLVDDALPLGPIGCW